MVYDAFRQNGLPTYYSANKTPVTQDVLVLGFIFAFVIVAVAFFAILPGIRGWQRLFTFIRITTSLFIGATIMISNFGQSWEVASLHNATTAYRAGRTGEIHADIGVKIGLRAVNITLKGIPEYQEEDSPAAGERVNYNERFSFDSQQGRTGFGRYSGRINREFREAQFRGLPYPILWIAEYFTIDGEDIRWGRSYRLAGYYASTLVWLSFPLWLIANILVVAGVLEEAFKVLFVTGSCMLGGNIIYASVRYGSRLVIPFAEHHVLTFTYGWSFYLCLIGGIIAVILSIVCLATMFFFPVETNEFFDIPEDPDSKIEYFHRRPRGANEIRTAWRQTRNKVTTGVSTHTNGWVTHTNGSAAQTNGLTTQTNEEAMESLPRKKLSRRRNFADLVMYVKSTRTNTTNLPEVAEEECTTTSLE